MSDPYAEWRYMVAHPQEIGKSIKITTTPIPGFYKRRMVKNGPFVPVWIYPQPENGDTGPWLARRTEEGTRKEVDAHREWEKCYGRPITQQEYEHVAEQGGEWFGTDRIVGEQMRDRAKPGDNNPPDDAEVLQDQINNALIGVEQYSKLLRWTKRGKTDVPVVESLIKDDDTFAKAQTMRSRLNELAREAEAEFRKEKDPINVEANRVDARWKFRQKAEEGALVIRSAMEIYQTAQLEAAKKAEEEARKAAEAAAEEEDFSFAAPPPPPPPPPPSVQTTVKGAYGRAATLGQKFDVVAITDQDAVYQYLKSHREMAPFLLQLAQRAVDAGHDVPGIEKKLRATVS